MTDERARQRAIIEPTPIAITELLARYDGVLLDVYGVLLDATGLLPGAGDLLRSLSRARKPFAIVTNDASRSPATYAHRFEGYGITLAQSCFVTSGSLLPGYFADRGIHGARTCVLGTADSVAYARAGGCEVVPLAPGMTIDALAVCDDDGFDFLPSIELALSAVVRAIEDGRDVALVLPNPDLVYPKSERELGFTAGAIALLLEVALARKFPARKPTFDRLGKPAPYLFLQAAHQLGVAPARLVMIGDQLETDGAGARAAGIDAALLAGVSRWEHARDAAAVAPHFLLATIAP
jgi:HAD superfamily hydrolase (TIGR01450 family)